MDLLLENGDLKKDSAGKPIPISGFDELKQQIYIRLKAKLEVLYMTESLEVK